MRAVDPLDATNESRVLLFTPTGRDAKLIATTLEASSIRSHICSSTADVVREMGAGCAAVLIAEESLNTESVKDFSRALDAQPTWSDLPLIVLTTSGEPTPVTEHKLATLRPLGNVSLVERPVRPATLVSIVQSAMRARDRQYQFREQAEALRRSNEDLQRFAHAASHDLQEPLRMIASYSQLLARRNKDMLDDDSRLFLRYITTGVDRMNTLIRDLLDFSRHTGSAYPPPTPADCNAALGLALQFLRFKITETSASITFDRLPTVFAHEARLVQVFQNLIGNALKYCDTQPQISILSRKEGSLQVISIKDNGIGIPAEHHDRIFGIFQRLHPQQEYPGSGIGLASCKRIVEQYGGRIWVESALGSGSTFHFTLPAAEAEAKPAASVAQR